MALIRCPRCGKEISDRGKLCPYCRFVPINGWEMKFPPPNKKYIKSSLVSILIAVALIVPGIWLFPYGGWLLVLIGVVLGMVSISSISSYTKASNAYKKGPVAYQEFMTRKTATQIELQDEAVKRAEEKEAKKYNYYRYKCPMCGSTRVITISTAKKAISAEAFGLGSKTIGKTYQCDECKYMW